MKIDVCIPVHDPFGTQSNYLEFLLLCISKQTKLPANICISANHPLPLLNSLKRKYISHFNINFSQNESTGISDNLNYAVSMSVNDVVKVMFQDDFIINSEYFSELAVSFSNSSNNWHCTSSLNYSDQQARFLKKTIPFLSPNLLLGINTIGSPSVIAVRRECWQTADSNLRWLLDCELYWRLGQTIGEPVVDNAFNIASRIHKFQATEWAKNFHESEIDYLKRKYSNVHR